jgi:adenine phosphoribosyltransferase
MDRLKQSLLDAPIIEKEGYHYFVHPISDGVPMLRPELLREIVIKIIRKAELDGEVALSQVTGYAENEMYVNDVYDGDRVLLLDDVLSTGGTLAALTGALEEIGADIRDIVCVIKKADGENKLAAAGYDAKTLINVVVEDGEVVITDEHGDE